MSYRSQQSMTLNPQRFAKSAQSQISDWNRQSYEQWRIADNQKAITNRANDIIMRERFKAKRAQKLYLRQQKSIDHYSQKLQAER